MQPTTDIDSLLAELGLASMNEANKEKFLDMFTETLQLRIGMRLEESLGDDKLQEFENMVDSGEDDKLSDWLETNVPGYQGLVQQEMESLKAEYKEQAPTILANQQ